MFQWYVLSVEKYCAVYERLSCQEFAAVMSESFCRNALSAVMLVVLFSYTLNWSVTNRSEQCTSFSTNIMFLSRNTWHNNKELLLERYYFLITILYKLWACFASTPQINIFVKCRTTLYFTPNHWSFGHKIAKGSLHTPTETAIFFFKKSFWEIFAHI